MVYYSVDPNYGSLRINRIRAAVRGVSLELITAPGVFSPSGLDRGSLALAESMEVPSQGKVLDLGCGYGFLGVLAALLSPKSTVTMIDSNKLAVKLASINAKLNGATNAVARQGDVLQGMDESFDLIVTNPPYSAGSRVVERFIVESAVHLSNAGSLQLVVPSKMKRGIQRLLEDAYGSVEEIGGTGSYKVYKAMHPKTLH
ncbi:16S rRNA methyltransferase [Thermocladium modestius]|uniref:16S rRNA methyltransferase n=1 Tax=Thermocladium modestius TaxID=62609 RepID=A0A830GTT5_9CREN|nr:16S rRNA methyltransferase [Thermocladium modestius]